jgi:hypothetical protein
MMLPAHYAIEGMCAACRSAIKSGVDRYRVGDRQYHADCFDISLVPIEMGGLDGPPCPPTLVAPRDTRDASFAPAVPDGLGQVTHPS